MKFLLFILAVLLPFSVFASGPSGYDVRFPVGVPMYVDTAVTNVTTGAWVQLYASTPLACSAVMLQNTGADLIALGTGGVGSEVVYTVIPVGQPMIVPVQIPRLSRLSLKALNANQSTGVISVYCFQ